ncbi:MAG TPA: ABC transporter permease [Vicinamibacterales bacterium]|jgi:predicted permease|nr:ABC transporter permease [Vicinamibacterales bacterium]
MSVPGEWFRRLRYLLNRGAHDEQLRREMEAHREMLPVRARFGNTLRLRDEARDVWGMRWIDDAGQDVRYAARTLVRGHRSFAASAVLTLAVAIGATTAVFTVVSGLLLRPLPFPNADRLVAVRGTTPHPAQGTQVTNLPFYRHESRALEAFAAYDVYARYMRGDNSVERVMAVRTEPAFFPILGVSALYGRTYDASDGPTVVVLSESFWRRRFGGNRDVIGRTLILDDRPYTVAGVMPGWFQFPYRAASLLEGAGGGPQRTDLWMPFDPPLPPRARLGSVVARLKPGVALAAAQGELDAIAARVDAIVPNNGRQGLSITPLLDSIVPAATRRLLLLFSAAVVIVLALACANVANLSLARMMLRQREVAVRAALGASLPRLARQFLTESLFVAFTGGLAGVLLAWWVVKRLIATAAPYLPRAHEVALDWRVSLFALAICTAVGVAVGLAPALIAARRDPRAALHESGGQSTMSRRQRRVRDSLVVAEVALAFMLGIAAAAVLRELIHLRATDSGIAPHNVITFHLGQPRGAAPQGGQRFYEIAGRVAQLPHVQAAGFAQMLPLQSWGWAANATDFLVRGQPPRTDEFTMELRFVTPGYFEAIGIPIRRGRGFTEADTPANPRVIIINETLARRAFPGEDPIGLVTTRGTIVGTIGDVRQAGLDRTPLPELYTPIAQNWSQVSDLGMTLVVRTADRPEPTIDAIRSVIRDADPRQAIFAVKTMDAVIEDSLSGFTLSMTILSAFAALAIAMALTGTYGVISYLASSRMREFAIRVALGSGAVRVSGLVLGRAFVLTGIGLGAGLLGATLSMPMLRAAPVAVHAPGGPTVLVVACLIAAVAGIAALLPARRAARVDPMTALRTD